MDKLPPSLSARQTNLIIGVLVILYAVGIIGAALPIHEDFLLLTPLNLLISMGLLLWAHPKTKLLWYYLPIGWVISFGIEAIGVNTGIPFGDYVYERVLGPKAFATPLMIGVNWLLLIFATSSVIEFLFPKLAAVWKPLLGALLMVALDVIIEPVAIKTGMWNWYGSMPPIQNYIAWFLVAYPLQRLFFQWNLAAANKVGAVLFLLQVVFFTTLLIVL